MHPNLIRFLAMAILFAIAFYLGGLVRSTEPSVPLARPLALAPRPRVSAQSRLPSPYFRRWNKITVDDCRAVPLETIRDHFGTVEEAERDPEGRIDCPVDTFSLLALRDPNPTFYMCDCKHVPHGAGGS